MRPKQYTFRRSSDSGAHLTVGFSHTPGDKRVFVWVPTNEHGDSSSYCLPAEQIDLLVEALQDLKRDME